ncbi:MAG: DUF2461 domain-containing protein [Lentimicrobium sp.]|nr:DUF2461 domain-containing protein [Lentimicrobium sp.]
MKQVLEFLTALSENNTREWFEANKSSYTKAKAEFEKAMSGFISGATAIDSTVGNPAVKDTVFRIFRDVRFSKDKAPYKTNMGGFIARGGRKSIYAGYYVHVEPEKSFVGGGIYMPQPEILKKIRQEVYFNAPEFRKIISDKEFTELFGSLADWDKLKRLPREYPADFPDAGLLMYKSYVVGHNLSNDDVAGKGFEDKVLRVFAAMKPMNDFLNRALE